MESKTTKRIEKKGNIINNKRFFSLDTSDFIHMFIAVHISQKNYCFNMELLLEFIDFCKKHDKYNDLLSNIEISYVNDELYSKELDSQVNLLRKERILYRKPLYEVSHIHINECLLLQKTIEDRTEFIDRMILFVNEYRAYETDKIVKFYENFCKRKVRNYREENKNFIKSILNNN